MKRNDRAEKNRIIALVSVRPQPLKTITDPHQTHVVGWGRFGSAPFSVRPRNMTSRALCEFLSVSRR